MKARTMDRLTPALLCPLARESAVTPILSERFEGSPMGEVGGARSPLRPWSLDIMPPEQEPIPKGLNHSAQGCAPSATLGGRWVREPTLKGLYPLSPSPRSIPHIISRKGPRCNPFRVRGSLTRAPRVALGAQPWAERCNPFGIVYGVAALRKAPARRGLRTLPSSLRIGV
jgi:hypothetical protein